MIYFIQMANFVKIGVSNNVNSRLKTLQTANPIKLKLLGTIPGNHKTEKTLHEEFKSQKISLGGSEWFCFDGKLKWAIISLNDSGRKHFEVKNVKQFIENGLHLQCRQKMNRVKKKKRNSKFEKKMNYILNKKRAV